MNLRVNYKPEGNPFKGQNITKGMSVPLTFKDEEVGYCVVIDPEGGIVEFIVRDEFKEIFEGLDVSPSFSIGGLKSVKVAENEGKNK